MVTTKGFRDVLSIGRQRRSSLYDLSFETPTPLIPRHLRFELSERISETGEPIEPLKEEEVREVAESLREYEIESVAVCFLHSYRNPTHELKTTAILKEELDDIFITMSHKVCPEYREYERFSTAAVNAVLQPQVWRYLQRISQNVSKLTKNTLPLYIMNNEGGIIGKEEAVTFPVKLVESGPAAGVIGADYLSDKLEEEKVITFDMGGTTAKVGAIIGSPYITTEYEIGGAIHRGRIVKGSGYPIRLPFIDLVEVSAGGGTELWIDEGDRLRIGPVSAGADPGPACYGLGGEQPTLTDASLLLHRLGRHLGGGEITLHDDLAKTAINAIATQVGKSPVKTAYSALRIANSKMGKAIRIATVERGFDPREFTLVAFGGMGPMTAPFLAEELNIRKVIIPPYPGVFSSFGLLVSDFKRTFTASILRTLEELTLGEVEKQKQDLREQAEEWVTTVSSEKKAKYELKAGLRYQRQSWELLTSLPWELDSLEEVKRRFSRIYRKRYGYSLHESPELVNLRVTAIGATDKPAVRFWKEQRTELKAHRKVHFEGQWINTPIYALESLGVDTELSGPAVFEGSTTTVIVPPDWTAQVKPSFIVEKRKK